jgi:hypothetical protein
MTIETYNKSCEILIRLNILDEQIDELERITKQDTTSWIMEIRELETFPLKKINHCGMLPEFLQAILSKCITERNKLQKEFDEL